MKMDKNLEKKLDELKFTNYINTNPVMQIDGKPIYVEDLVKAGLIGKLNTFIVGESGEGKTQIEKDVMALAGNKATFILGRDDMDVRALFTTMGTDIKKVKTLAELRQFTKKLGYNIFVVDELTRCLPQVQNNLFNLFDGIVEVDGTECELGDGFSVGLASGNVGNGKYFGAHKTERGLNDRMHLFFDIDNIPTLPEDDFEIDTKYKDPRVKNSKGKDRMNIVKDLHEQVKEEDISLIPYVMAWYFKKGLDYIPNFPGESKRKIKDVWPNLDLSKLGTHEKGSDYDLIFPMSKRSGLSALELTRALSLIAKAKGAKDINYKDLILDVFKVTLPYQGILNPAKVDTNFYGNPYLAMEGIIQGIEGELRYKPSGSDLTRIVAIEEAISLAQKGKLYDKLNQDYFEGRWKFMQNILKKIAYKSKEQK